MYLTNQENASAFKGLRVAAVAAAVVAVMLSGCGDDKKSDKASQTAAKVNKEEITVHQINFVLQRQQGLKPEQAEAASRQVLERLIEQELAVQKAQELKLDRDPRVVQQIEAAKREIIARSYVERIGESVAKPSSEEVSKYYNEKPALFKDRRIYSLQELAIEAKPEQFGQLRQKLESAKNIGEFAEYLKSNDFRFTANQAVRAAEQLPLNGLESIARMKDGDSAVTQTANGITVLFLVGSRSQPVDEARARPAIEAFLVNQRKAELVQKDLKGLREAAKIDYIGKFAEGAPGAKGAAASAPAAAATPAPTAAPVAADPVAPAASGLNAADISKGMGLK
ncbi:peptidyl-prolyl cis-trans isomerase, EpsD family [Paucibacter aquatile]|jgi:EpsD family peptidyl-prolyl cis-trans isomerase|uniref:Peptidyl-prolyl cis-trans isomerase, EpsD family n=1 Tax=Kinneretia aquatilis TaxID=2070761 RepID=A0A2N8KW81_9BURK|nr:EpsD family peptidyl-prolyl cis-trans isomerase [Paucibacter aquatile]PND37662.1 peptidyl-prolyl cis-trans isomerase, EpsD family [Paucibacter aquatile]WIV96563.1 EpsD family peptidyl-prolyl cis-trans isomerase [Paucibacter aquatile]